MKFNKPEFWNKNNFLSLFLLPLSVFTLIFNYIKSLIITEYSYKIPIICVGNIYVGGTGKTPLSIYIYNLLKRKKFKPAIVKKYYPSQIDEINFTKNKVKHFFSDKKRSLSILKAEKKNNNVIIMDDGLQDVSIKKNLSILCFNSSDLIGNGFLLPAGPLRDRLKKINNYQIVVINGKKNIAFEKKLKSLSNKIKIFNSKYEIKKIGNYKSKKILAFAGIGSPQNFFDLLKDYKLNIKEKISFPDHYNYTKDEIRNLMSKAKEKNLKLITTEKDYFRIKQLGLKKIEYISVDLKIIKYKEFEKEVLKNI